MVKIIRGYMVHPASLSNLGGIKEEVVFFHGETMKEAFGQLIWPTNIYACEICAKEYNTEEDAEKCEQQCTQQ